VAAAAAAARLRTGFRWSGSVDVPSRLRTRLFSRAACVIAASTAGISQESVAGRKPALKIITVRVVARVVSCTPKSMSERSSSARMLTPVPAALIVTAASAPSATSACSVSA